MVSNLVTWSLVAKSNLLDLWEISDMKGKIRVYARWRPLSSKEVRERQQNVLIAPDEFTIEHPWKDDKPKQHQFDHVFDHHATQEEVFEDTKVLVLRLRRKDSTNANLSWDVILLVRAELWNTGNRYRNIDCTMCSKVRI